MSRLPVRSAYVHVPFCRHRCGYCNFTVIANRDDLVEDFLRAIEIELSWISSEGSVEVDTLFFGGGTPTHLSPSQLERFFSVVSRTFLPSEDCEISIEANPEDIDPAIIDVCSAFGVNRVSLGVQSFREDKLQTLERGHRGEQVTRCVDAIRTKIDNVSLDLIFGSPNETLQQWQRDLEQAIQLCPTHISTYGLTYEPGTQFHVRREKQELRQLPEDLEREMYELAIDRLTAGGYEHYEVSNFALPGSRCRHNENYWLCGPFYGVGPGASSFVHGVRRSNHRSTTTYLKRVLANEPPVEESEQLTEEDLAHERLVFGMRRLDGIDREKFRVATGLDVTEVAGENLNWLVEEGLLELTEQNVRLTRKGLLVSDSIWPYLL